MFDTKVKEIKKLFLPKESEIADELEKSQSPPPPTGSPINDGKKFIGSGEDANFFNN